jgi:hypothetical protein
MESQGGVPDGVTSLRKEQFGYIVVSEFVLLTLETEFRFLLYTVI